MDFTYLFRVLWKAKWYILLAGLVAASSAYFFTKRMKPQYQSNAQISTGFTLNDDLTQEGRLTSPYEIDLRFANAIELFTSPGVLSLVMYDLLLHDLDSHSANPFTHIDPATLQSLAGNKSEIVKYIKSLKDNYQIFKPTDSMGARVNDLANHMGYGFDNLKRQVTVQRVLRSDFINISTTTTNSELSAFFANNLVTNFVAYNKNLHSDRSAESVVVLDSLVAEKRRMMKEKSEALNSFKTAKGLISTNIQGGSAVNSIRQFEGELLAERNRLQGLKLSMADVDQKLNSMESGGASNVNAEIVALRNKIRNLEAQRNKSLEKNEALDAQIAELKDQYDLKLSQLSTGNNAGGLTKDQLKDKKSEIQIAITTSEQKITAFQSKLAELSGESRDIALSSANEESLQREAKAAEEEYNNALTRYNVAMVKKTGLSGNITQSIEAQPSYNPLPSKRWAIVAISGLGLMAAVAALALLLAVFDRSIKSPSAFSRQVGWQPIAVIGAANLGSKSIHELVHSTEPEKGGNRENTFREAMRKLRYEIEKSGKHIILFTSTEPQQGKTTIIQALAYSFRMSNKKVLILDTNFCNNDLTVQLGADKKLEKVSLQPQQFHTGVLKDYITTTTEGVDVIGCEGGDYTPNEILPKNNVLKLLPRLREEYDFILIEGAPLNDYTDSRELEEYVEGIVCVFSAKAVFENEDKASLEFIKSRKEKFIGAILNNVSEEELNTN